MGIESMQTSALDRGFYGNKLSCLFGEDELFILMFAQNRLQVSYLDRCFVILWKVRMKVSKP